MGKSIRTSVCFPPALHTDIKVTCAVSRVSLTEFVASIVAGAEKYSDKAIKAAFDALEYEPPANGKEASLNTAVRASVTLAAPLAKQAKARAEALGLDQSRFIVGAVAHHMARNGK